MSELRKGLVVLRVDGHLSQELRRDLQNALSLAAEKAGMTGLVIEAGMEVDVHHDLSPLINSVNQQTAALNRLVETNQALLISLIDDDVAEASEGSVAQYLDGSREL